MKPSWFIACTLLLLLAGTAPAVETVTLAHDGKPAVRIVVAERAHPSVRETAVELAGKLAAMLGGPVPVETGNGADGIALGLPGDFAVWQADPALQLDKRLAETNDLATAQSYVMRTHGKGVALIGATEIGVEYAAWDFLHRLGYRHFFPGPTWEVVPRLTGAVTLNLDTYEKPDYLARNIWYGFGGNQEPKQAWNFRNRATFHGTRADFRPGMSLRWKTTLISTLHVYGAIISQHKALFAEHPEYLALIKGERKGSKLCLSNPNVPPLAVAFARSWLERTPYAASVSMEPSDGYGWCECEECAKLGSPSDRMLMLANFVAKELEATHPHVYVGVLAYNEHAAPPAIAAHPRVIVECATQLSGNVPIEVRLKGWSEKATTLGIYDYWGVAQWHNAMPGRMKGGDLAFISTCIPEFYALGARTMTAESGDCWGPNGLGYYVAARLLWNTKDAARVPEIVDDFLTRAFGPAAEPMRTYYALVDNSLNAETGGPRPGSIEYFEDRAPRMYAAILAALDRAGGDPAVEARLNDLLCYTRYIQLWTLNRRAATPVKGEDADAALQRSQLALERFIRFSNAIRDTNMAHWQGIKSITAGANKVDLQAPPPWLPEDERQAFTALTKEARAERLREWTTVTPALIEEVRQAARKAVAKL